MLTKSDLIRLLTDAKTYGSRYPKIKQYNVFSMSTISFSVDKQVAWKLGQNKEPNVWDNIRMAKGRILHEYIQTRLPPSYQFEIEILLPIPYKWTNHPFHEILLLGHIDVINFKEREILEIKTSEYSNAIKDYHLIQASLYWLYYKIIRDENFEIHIAKLGSGLVFRTLSNYEKEHYAHLGIENALAVAKRLDV